MALVLELTVLAVGMRGMELFLEVPRLPVRAPSPDSADRALEALEVLMPPARED